MIIPRSQEEEGSSTSARTTCLTCSANPRASCRPTVTVEMDSWMVSVTSPGHTVNRPFFMTCRLPATLTGTTGR